MAIRSLVTRSHPLDQKYGIRTRQWKNRRPAPTYPDQGASPVQAEPLLMCDVTKIESFSVIAGTPEVDRDLHACQHRCEFTQSTSLTETVLGSGLYSNVSATSVLDNVAATELIW